MSSNSFGQTNANDETKIKQVLTGFTTAGNNHDAKAFSEIFTDDADLTNVRGQSYHGKSEIETHYEPIFATRFKGRYFAIFQYRICQMVEQWKINTNNKIINKNEYKNKNCIGYRW